MRESPMKFCPQCTAHLEWRVVDDVERLACSSRCGYVHWNNPIPVVAGLVRVGDEFILARNARWPANLFSVITGFLEKGESPEEAISREMHEELGLNTEALEFVGHYAFAGMNQLIIAFAVRAGGELRLGAEIAEVKRCSRAELARFDFGGLDITARIVQAALAMSHSRGEVERVATSDGG